MLPVLLLLLTGAKPPKWVLGAPKVQDLSRFEGLQDTPELMAVLHYLNNGPDAAVAVEAGGEVLDVDLLFHQVLSAAMHGLVLEASLIQDPVEFTSVLRRVCSWFQDMVLSYEAIVDERHESDRKAQVRPSGPSLLLLLLLLVVMASDHHSEGGPVLITGLSVRWWCFS